jgi:hypothetical protein
MWLVAKARPGRLTDECRRDWESIAYGESGPPFGEGVSERHRYERPGTYRMGGSSGSTNAAP